MAYTPSVAHARTPQSTNSGAPRRPVDESLTGRQRQHLWQLGRIKREHQDGEPITGIDAKFLLSVLAQHPRAAEKIGPGVRAFTVDTFVHNTRCFFVIRTDGSVIDFSAARCVTGQWQQHSPRTQQLMDRFPYAAVIRRWLAAAGRLVAAR